MVVQAFIRSGGQCECVDPSCEVGHYPFQCHARFSFEQRTTSDLAGYQADHYLPYALGGSATLENCRILCVPCHKSKTARQSSILAQFSKLKR
ncbi:HNH endonuclease [Candidatus Binatus sp.]|uniref:HNH endonuclease n=1 Tax=Candidatus Binatus sp. TaxID=2811406 RepID=UPI003CC6607E